MHYFIGNLGHILVCLAFVSALFATFFFAKSIGSSQSWGGFAKAIYYVHAAAIFGVVITLFLMISGHMFEYHYVYMYTSSILPVYYQISSFWNGQEGSFLLWMFWNAVLGLVLIHTNKSWTASVMAVFTFTQAFLVSMILGVVVGDVKIGSSPFMLLRDVVQDSIFLMQPDFIPEEGRGLNPLLQNYWMVIHPPTLFLGFATTVIPFAFAMAGLLTGRLRDWIRPALPWAQFSAAVLGVGILMGAYWAYETLNFGGYWNWDPVENAIYVPWLVLVGGIHTMIAYRKNPSALKASLMLVLATYVLIVYSTFLTRSGVLGNSSVHSFTDLGLSGQLLVYLIVFTLLSIGLCAWRWGQMPKAQEEVSVYSREFWIFMGATVLCLMAFQVIIPTSIPVWNELVEFFGGTSNLAPPAEQIEFYTQWQLYFAILLAVLSGTGQFFWWNKMDRGALWQALKVPLMVSLIAAAAIFVVAKIYDLSYLLLLIASVYSIVANSKILFSVAKSNIKLSGGAVAHIGMAMMLIGVLFSSGYSKMLSKNNTGMVWSNDFPEEVNRDNLLLFINEPRRMEDYTLTYKGMRKLTSDHGYVDISDVRGMVGPLDMVIEKETMTSDGTPLAAGDTVKLINAENSYFEVAYERAGSLFTLYPRIQMNKQMGSVYSPDINRTLTADLYTHVRTFPDPESEVEWSEEEAVQVKPGDKFFVNDYVARFIDMKPINSVNGIPLTAGDIAVKAIIEVEGESKKYLAEPIYVIRDQMAGRIPDVIDDLAAKITIQSIEPQANSFVFGVSTTQKDWIIIEAQEKPWINVLWLGTLLLVVGFTIAIVRRYGEFRKMRDKGME